MGEGLSSIKLVKPGFFFSKKLIADFPSVTSFAIISMVIAKKKKKSLINSGEKQTTVVCLVLDPHAKLRTPHLWA